MMTDFNAMAEKYWQVIGSGQKSMLKLFMIQPFFGGNCLIVDLSLRKEYLAAAVDYVRFHSLMLDFKAVRQEYLESIAVTQ